MHKTGCCVQNEPFCYGNKELGRDLGAAGGGKELLYLQGPAFVVLRVDPGSQRELGDEDLGGLGEQHGGFCTDHLPKKKKIKDYFEFYHSIPTAPRGVSSRE